MIDIQDLRNSILSRLHTETCKIQAEYHSRSIENLYFDGNTYGIAACSLRGYWGLFSKIPQNFAGNVLVPEQFISIPIPFRQVNVLSTDKGIALLSIRSKIPIKYPFQLIDGKKNPVYGEYKAAETLSSRKTNHIIVLEEARLLHRALDDHIDVRHILYTNKSKLIQDGTIKKAVNSGIPCFSISEGLLATITTTRPVPSEIALCTTYSFTPQQISCSTQSNILIADNIENPDNLGLILRTADACGADAVISVGNIASIYHKNCIRASRGALGRFPVMEYSIDEFPHVLCQLKEAGYIVCGSSAKTDQEIGNLPTLPRRAFVVSNETNGISPQMRASCDEMLRIPMATGQSSLNVAVAAGIILSHTNNVLTK